MLPLVGELAPPKHRAAALSIVVSGLMFGLLIARVLSGTVTDFVSWRVVYWLALGLQSAIFILLYLFMPDYPSTNPQGINYFRMLWSIVVLLIEQPLLVQSCLISFFTAATFTSFWTTLTFLLAGSPYHYSSLTIGLFGLIGIGGMTVGPVYARFVTDRFVPHFSVIVGEFVSLVGIVIGTYTGTFTVAGPILQAFICDCGFQTAQIANRAAIYALDPKARNRINTAFMVATFFGQLMGTAAGNHIYAHGGWIRNGSASVGFVGASLLFCFVRGPWEEGWIGWHGGWNLTKDPEAVGQNAAGQVDSATAENHGEETAVPMTVEKEGIAQEHRYRSSEDHEDRQASEKSLKRESISNGSPVSAPTEKI
jgi:predicted MFS family arabinose efflux permease